MDLSGVNLAEANLFNTDLSRANLNGADLEGVNLREADLSGANLSNSRLCRAMLADADLRYSQLSRCDLAEATLTGAKLYGTAKDDWVIEGIKCEYVFWDSKGETRSPQNRHLSPGEFEQLYRTLPAIEYVFQGGMTPMDLLIMDRVVQTIRQQNPEYDIRIDSITTRGLAPSIKFTVQQREHKALALEMIIDEYENRIRSLEADKGLLYEQVQRALDIIEGLAAADRDQFHEMLRQAMDKAGPKFIGAGPGTIVAIDSATIHSIDVCTNFANPDADELFQELCDVIRSLVEDKVLSRELLQKVAEMQQAKGTKTFRERYREFLSLAADYMGVVTPFLPALAQIAKACGG